MALLRKIIMKLLLTIYYFTVFYYTLYSAYKSANEYFCVQKRADNVDFKETVTANCLNVSKLGYNQAGVNRLIFSMNGRLILFNNSNQNFMMVDANHHHKKHVYYDSYVPLDNFNMEYKVDKNFFKIRCRSKIGELPKDGFKSVSFDNTYYDGYRTESIVETGFFTSVFEEQPYIKNPFQIKTYDEIICTLEKSPETCSMRTETTNNAFLIFIIIVAMISISHVLVLLEFNRYFFLRLYKRFTAYSQRREINIDFCNPITGDASYLDKGDKVFQFTDCVVNMDFDYHKLSRFKDKRGEYWIESDKTLIIKTEDDFIHIPCDERSCLLIQNYFFEISKDHKRCLCNDEKTHYFSTQHVLLNVLQGRNIELVKVDKKCLILDVKEYEYNIISKITKGSEKVCKLMLEHNQRFFGGCLNFDALLTCIKGKLWFNHIPSKVGNSQWKRYTSDFCWIVKENLNKEMKCQKLLGKSKLLKALCDIDMNDIKIIKTPEFVEINKSSVDAKSKLIKKVVYNLESTAKRFMPSNIIPCMPMKENEYETDYYKRAVELEKMMDNQMEKEKQPLKVKLTNTKEIINSARNEFKGRLMCKLNMMKSYKDVLLNPAKKLNKTTINKISKLNKEIRKSDDVGKIAVKKETIENLTKDEKNYEFDSVPYDHIRRKFFELKFKDTCMNNYSTIKTFDKILELLDEDEKNANNIQDEADNVVRVKVKAIINSSKNILTTNKKKRVKLGKKKSKSTKKDKIMVDSVELKKSLVSSDFETNLKIAVQMINNNSSEIKMSIGDCEVNNEIRPKTAHTIKQIIKNCCYKDSIRIANKNHNTREFFDFVSDINFNNYQSVKKNTALIEEFIDDKDFFELFKMI